MPDMTRAWGYVGRATASSDFWTQVASDLLAQGPGKRSSPSAAHASRTRDRSAPSSQGHSTGPVGGGPTQLQPIDQWPIRGQRYPPALPPAGETPTAQTTRWQWS